MKAKRLAILLVVGACTCAEAATYFDYPDKPVHIVVGAGAGDTNDLAARIVAPPLADLFKQPFLIDDQPGANGSRAATLVAKAPADGHTVLLVSAPFATTVSLYPGLPYHPERDFTAVARLATFPQLLVVQPSVNVRTLAEFIARIRATPGRVVIASSGTGTTSHLLAELMKLNAGWLDALHVPYKGVAPALAGILGGHVDALIVTASVAQAYIRSGRLQPLAVASPQRLPALPSVPTFREAGLSGVEATAWIGVVAPAKTPYEPVTRLSVALADVLKLASVRQRFANQGAETIVEGPDEFSKYLHAEVERWAKVIKASGIGPE